ncbi:hypothetical protein LX32DRAFT_292454 [Colletotrichum zoysiae]|uniref:Uncharacterized protein n=1 Tax=Colletotrichum zoysiae TaxID=1216348 RepID=A0AAD9M1X1_9PEZI|nr:hypothetical protein LX32DRAFT_292454 [Colletotrichum zoysiae]
MSMLGSIRSRMNCFSWGDMRRRPTRPGAMAAGSLGSNHEPPQELDLQLQAALSRLQPSPPTTRSVKKSHLFTEARLTRASRVDAGATSDPTIPVVSTVFAPCSCLNRRGQLREPSLGPFKHANFQQLAAYFNPARRLSTGLDGPEGPLFLAFLPPPPPPPESLHTDMSTQSGGGPVAWPGIPVDG